MADIASAVLRAADSASGERIYRLFVDDLRLASAALDRFPLS